MLMTSFLALLRAHDPLTNSKISDGLINKWSKDGPDKSDTFVQIMERKKHSESKQNRAEMAKSAKEKLDLWKRMEEGDIKALMKLSFMRGIITEEEYADFQRIEKEHGGG